LFSVETRTVAGQVTAIGSAGSFTLVVDRPVEAGGGGKGFNGGQLLAREVDRIAEIPNSLRQGTAVSLGEIRIVPG
jgi:hypothetical protein